MRLFHANHITWLTSRVQVKYWALGNETWGPWQVEQMTKEAYSHKAYQWAKGKFQFSNAAMTKSTNQVP